MADPHHRSCLSPTQIPEALVKYSVEIGLLEWSHRREARKGTTTRSRSIRASEVSRHIVNPAPIVGSLGAERCSQRDTGCHSCLNPIEALEICVSLREDQLSADAMNE